MTHQQLDEIRAALATANDRLAKEIAEREHAQAALAQSQKMAALGRLAGDVAHEFNNHLHVVNLNLELVSLYANDERVRPVVDRAKAAARRGAKLTGQLLKCARKQSLRPTLTRVNSLLADMRDLIEISAGSGVTVEFDFCEQELPVVVAPGQLEMAVLGVVVNSRDAMLEGGKLRIATRVARGAEGQLPAGDYVVVAMSDTGTGTTQEMYFPAASEDKEQPGEPIAAPGAQTALT